ncbi:hypothetical protein AX16_002909 [Volvariella volvacea WC 439]|nr:hypothetical protein AX16_002909 [Volvariella volvacea WC 439]
MIPPIQRPPNLPPSPPPSHILSYAVHDMPVHTSDFDFEEEFYECYIKTLPKDAVVKVEGHSELSRLDVYFRLMEWRRRILGCEDEEEEAEKEVARHISSGSTIPGLRSEDLQPDAETITPIARGTDCEELHTIPDIYNTKDFDIPPLVLQIHDLVGHRRLQSGQDGFFYYDPAIYRLVYEMHHRGIPYWPDHPALLCSDAYQARAVRVYAQVPTTLKVGNMYEGLYQFVGECYPMITHKFLNKEDWRALDKKTRDFFITRRVQMLKKSGVHAKRKQVQRLFNKGGVFPLVVLRQVRRPQPQPRSASQPTTRDIAGGNITQRNNDYSTTTMPPAMTAPAYEINDDSRIREEELGPIPATPAPEYATEEDIASPQSELASLPDTPLEEEGRSVARIGIVYGNLPERTMVSSPHVHHHGSKAKGHPEMHHDEQDVALVDLDEPREERHEDSGIETDASADHVDRDKVAAKPRPASQGPQDPDAVLDHGQRASEHATADTRHPSLSPKSSRLSTETIDQFDRTSLRARRLTDDSIAWLASMFRDEQKETITNDYVDFLESAYADRRRKKQTFFHIDGMLQTCYAQLSGEGDSGRWDEVLSSSTPPPPNNISTEDELNNQGFKLGVGDSEDLYEPIESFERFKARYKPGASDTHTI